MNPKLLTILFRIFSVYWCTSLISSWLGTIPRSIFFSEDKSFSNYGAEMAVSTPYAIIFLILPYLGLWYVAPFLGRALIDSKDEFPITLKFNTSSLVQICLVFIGASMLATSITGLLNSLFALLLTSNTFEPNQLLFFELRNILQVTWRAVIGLFIIILSKKIVKLLITQNIIEEVEQFINVEQKP